ncbi:MAG TPA: hypothetical protein VMM76_14355 [Pirellulaceae bacterium]|nr:hypothetical protein [Pirellulaceae bacterium]
MPNQIVIRKFPVTAATTLLLSAGLLILPGCGQSSHPVVGTWAYTLTQEREALLRNADRRLSAFSPDALVDAERDSLRATLSIRRAALVFRPDGQVERTIIDIDSQAESSKGTWKESRVLGFVHFLDVHYDDAPDADLYEVLNEPNRSPVLTTKLSDVKGFRDLVFYSDSQSGVNE